MACPFQVVKRHAMMARGLAPPGDAAPSEDQRLHYYAPRIEISGRVSSALPYANNHEVKKT